MLDSHRPALSAFLAAPPSRGWLRALLWVACIAALVSLGAVSGATEAEIALSGIAILPVLAIAWNSGVVAGLATAAFAALVLSVADHLSGRSFSADWMPWANAAARLMAYAVVAFFAAKTRQLLLKVHEAASVDGLTGIRNRRAFLEAGAAEVERSRRHGRPLAVVFVDLDRFKALNDAKGHARGDAALRVTANALVGALRAVDHVARVGGDEFAAVLPEIEFAAVSESAARIAAAIGKALGSHAPVTASVGVAWFARADREFPEMVKIADALMYEAKASRSGAVVVRDVSLAPAPGDANRRVGPDNRRSASAR
jgi:diguanylate cyclase (GGDEF)-like protein